MDKRITMETPETIQKITFFDLPASSVAREAQLPFLYERFFYTRNLFHTRYHEFIMKLNQSDILSKFRHLLKLQNLTAYDFGKLVQRIEKWNRLTAPIPAVYLDFIGVHASSLETTLKTDMNAFKDAMNMNFSPDCFYVDIPSGSLRVSLPEGLTEADAIAIAKSWHHTEKYFAKYIRVKDLKTIVIQPDGHHYMLSYPPVLSRRNDLYLPLQPGECYNGRKIP